MFNGIRIHCGHTICISCLSDYIFNQIDNGVTCIKCPQFKCKALIDDSIIHVLSDVIAYGRYRQFLQNSFLDTSSNWKFCPNPKCNSAIKCQRDVPLLICNCSTPLCTSCMDKFHWPLTCKENTLWAARTKVKDKVEDPNLPDLPKFEGQKYEMSVETKPCPRCKTRWEKNGGCNHIHCRKCFYHFCWVCLKEFNQQTHDDFYVCKQGFEVATKKENLQMEVGTASYNEALKSTLELRKKMRLDHEQKVADLREKKRSSKRAVQHERASIFLTEKYLNKSRRMKVLLKQIVNATETSNEKVPGKLNMKFIYKMISRMIESHLMLSRAYKLISYFNLSQGTSVCSIVESLEHVVFRMDAMFQDPKQYLPWSQCQWKFADLKFYLDFLVKETLKYLKARKKGNTTILH